MHLSNVELKKMSMSQVTIFIFAVLLSHVLSVMSPVFFFFFKGRVTISMGRGPQSYLTGHMTMAAGSRRQSVRISEERPTCQLELRTSHLQGNIQSLQQAVIGGERRKWLISWDQLMS